MPYDPLVAVYASSFEHCLTLAVERAKVMTVKKDNGIVGTVCDFIKFTPKNDPVRQKLSKVYNKFRGMKTSLRRLNTSTQELLQSLPVDLSEITSERLQIIENSLLMECKIRVLEYDPPKNGERFGNHRVIWSSSQKEGVQINLIRNSKDNFTFYSDDFFFLGCCNCPFRSREGCDQCVNVCCLWILKK